MFTAIVVIPFKAFKEDIKCCCTSTGISCIDWVSDCPFVAIVLVAVENLVDADFQMYLRTLIVSHQLARIVIEGGHVAILAAEYQHSM
jgi:hypothetical protein